MRLLHQKYQHPALAALTSAILSSGTVLASLGGAVRRFPRVKLLPLLAAKLLS